MRLTLRTLLAYLDDTLEPEQAKLIGQKVAESPVAQELVERIKTTTRRRSLANPSIQGAASGMDPNTVAEYLDGEIAGDDLSQVEQTCLDDDVYLAEVAACHQILTLMLSDPSPIPPPARQRIYRIVKGRESIPYRKPPAFLSDARPAAVAGDAKSEERSARTLFLVAAMLFLLFGLAASIALAWPHSRPARSPARIELASVPPVVVVEPSAKPFKDPKGNLPNDPVPPEILKQQPMPEPVKPAPAENEPPKVALDRVPPSDASTEAREVGQFVTADSLLLANSTRALDGWRVVPRNGTIASGAALMSLPGYRNSVRFNGGIQVTLWGNLVEFLPIAVYECLVTPHAPAAGIDADLTLDHGRILIVNPQGKPPARVRLRFRTEVWDLTLKEGAEMLVDGLASYSPGTAFSRQPGGESPFSELNVGVTKGAVTLHVRDLPAIELAAPPGPALMGWDNKGRVREPLKLAAPLPQWVAPPLPKAREPGAELKNVLDDLARRIAQPEANIQLALTELAQSKNPESQTYAAYALPAIDIVTEGIDALDHLLTPEKPRLAAIVALRHWIARSPENARTLHRLLMEKKNYSEAQADVFVQLLHSFSEEDLAKAPTYEFFFQQLNDAKLATRILAYWHLAQVDQEGAKSSNYNPLADNREPALARWRKRLTDGKLPPKPPKP